MVLNYIDFIFIVLVVFMVVITLISLGLWLNVHAEQVNHDFSKCVKMFDYRTCEIFYPPLNFQKV